MFNRSLVATGLLMGGLSLVHMAAHAGWSQYDSPISEVDACNQAQYLMPAKAMVQEFRFSSTSGKSGTNFRCSVRWSEGANAPSSNRPILFPNRIDQPIFAAGWL